MLYLNGDICQNSIQHPQGLHHFPLEETFQSDSTAPVLIGTVMVAVGTPILVLPLPRVEGGAFS